MSAYLLFSLGVLRFRDVKKLFSFIFTGGTRRGE
jgi:hypothetical protein